MRILCQKWSFTLRIDRCGEKAGISHSEFADSLICTVNTKGEILSGILDLLNKRAKEFGRQDIIDYIDFCREQFSEILGG